MNFAIVCWNVSSNVANPAFAKGGIKTWLVQSIIITLMPMSLLTSGYVISVDGAGFLDVAQICKEMDNESCQLNGDIGVVRSFYAKSPHAPR